MSTCPQCGKPLPAGAERWKPFCSERCKLGDLGQWFAGRYAIPADAATDADAPTPDQKPRQ